MLLSKIAHKVFSVHIGKLLLQLVPVSNIQQIDQIQNGRQFSSHLLGNLFGLKNLFLQIIIPPTTPAPSTYISLLNSLHHGGKDLNHSKSVFSSHSVVDVVQSLLFLLSLHVVLDLMKLLLHTLLQPRNILHLRQNPEILQPPDQKEVPSDIPCTPPYQNQKNEA